MSFSPGCQASLGAQADAAGTAEIDAETRGSTTRAPEIPAELQSAELSSQTDGALLGARPDLTFNGPATALCTCLEVAVGDSASKAFTWDSQVPLVDPSTQLAFAMTSRELGCEGATFQGASYQGYLTRGPDVVILIEPAVTGRPLVEGALVPRPGLGGSMTVERSAPDLPYGRAKDGDSPCVVLPKTP